MKSFGSDNHSGIHPLILEAIAQANNQHAPAYGDDQQTLLLKKRLEDTFGCQDSYVVMNGTGANILALATITRSFHAVLCASTAHINVDECGAPERATGCKLIGIDTPDGKLTPALIKPHIAGFGFQHHTQPGVISISQPTELGTLYQPQEIRLLADIAHQHGMYLHIDGARMANAIAALGCHPSEMGHQCGADVISLGGTKNGIMIGEVVMFFDNKWSQKALYHRKQTTQLASKMRFISAQLNAYLTDDLYIRLADHANRQAAYLAKQLSTIEDVCITQKVESNALFVVLPEAIKEHLLKYYFFYTWNEQTGEIRLMTSFDTKTEEIDTFIACIKMFQQESR